MKNILIFLSAFLLLNAFSYAQLQPKDFGYRHETFVYEKDTVDILIKSKKGEELLKKPIIFEVQGSTAVPLIVHDGKQLTSTVSLTEGFVEDTYHLILICKPGIPLIVHKDQLTKGKYKDPQTKQYPKKYLTHNNLSYYVQRNREILAYLKKQSWVDTAKIVLVGHSEGSSIVAHMAATTTGITHLIYSGGLPYFPRILAMIQQERQQERNSPNPWVQKSLEYWKDVIAYPNALGRNKGWNTNKGTFSFSQNENIVLKKLNIPVLISYGTKDEASPFNDMFHVEIIKDKRINFTFFDYVGLNHYYQYAIPPKDKKIPIDQLSKVVQDWLQWIEKHSK